RKPPSPRRAAGSADASSSDAADDTLLLGLPLYRQHGGWFPWLVPLAAVCLLLASVAAVWMALRSTTPVQGRGAGPGGPPVAVRPAAGPPAPQPEPGPNREPDQAPQVTPEPTPPEVKPEPKSESPAPPPAPSPERRPLGRYVLAGGHPSVLLQ